MGHRFDRLSALLLPPHLRAGSPEQELQGRVLTWLIVTAFAGAVFVNLYTLAVGDLRVWPAHFAFLAAVAAVPVVAHRTRSPATLHAFVVATAWLVLALVTALSGGARSATLYYFGLAPVLAAALGGRILAARAALATLAAIVAFFLLEAAGVRFPTDSVYAETPHPPSAAAATLLVYGIAAVFAHSRRAARAALARAIASATTANARRAAARAELARAERAKRLALGKVGAGLRQPLDRFAAAAARLPAALPAPLADHGVMLARAAAQLTARLDAFAAYAAVGVAPAAAIGPVDVPALARDIAAPFAAAATAKGLRFTLDHGGLDAPRRLLDPERLGFALAALLDNAVKFTPSGAITLLLASPTPTTLRLEVRDTGPGIPIPLLARAFDPLVRGDATSTRRHGGAGLGLAIVRRFTETAGGQLDCEQPAHGGCHIALTLPAPAAPAPTTAPTEAPC